LQYITNFGSNHITETPAHGKSWNLLIFEPDSIRALVVVFAEFVLFDFSTAFYDAFLFRGQFGLVVEREFLEKKRIG
jgi:hypothetical protein